MTDLKGEKLITREFLEKQCKTKLVNGYVYRVFYEGGIYVIDTRK